MDCSSKCASGEARSTLPGAFDEDVTRTPYAVAPDTDTMRIETASRHQSVVLKKGYAC
jgi:hypothetical protein